MGLRGAMWLGGALGWGCSGITYMSRIMYIRCFDVVRMLLCFRTRHVYCVLCFITH